MYHAFISYSHLKDRPIAAALQSVIQTLGKPWWKRRASRVFRKALRDAHRWLDELLFDPTQTIELLAIRESKSERSIRMKLSLAFISPVLAEAAMEGRLPRGFCVKRLTDLPMLWSEQWRAVGLREPDSGAGRTQLTYATCYPLAANPSFALN